MSQKQRNFFVLSLGVVLGVGLAIGQGVFADRSNRETAIPLDELRTFTEVFSKIKSDYVEPVPDKELLEHAISGMLSNLDPHSAYLDAKAFKELQVGTSGEFGGLGIEVTMENGFVKVMSPIDDTPAQRAGIRAGDVVIRLDDTPVKGLTLKEAVDIMRGKPGTKITLTIIREGEEQPLKVEVVRAIIKVRSVKSRMLDDGFGYLRITQFQSHTAENLIDAISKLKKESTHGLYGVVLDLRNNPGGVLNAAVSVSDAFLEKGLIVYTEGRVKDSELKFQATPSDVLKGAPIVVLINAGSASASEIVAGALQDHRRAVIMGEKSFGKGSVQTIIPIGHGAAVKLTTARYFTPSGRSIQAEGITPDIPLQRVKVDLAENSGFQPVKEADLSGHLDNGNGGSEGEGDSGQSETEGADKASTASLVKSDYQLYEALNLLKGLHILQQQQK